MRVLALHLCLLCGPLAAVVFGGLGLLLDALGCLGLPLAACPWQALAQVLGQVLGQVSRQVSGQVLVNIS